MDVSKIYSVIDKAVFNFDMIPSGSKILIGASGGKDSTLLIEYLAHRLKRRGADFSITALYIKTDFASDFNPELKKLMESWGVHVETLYVNTLERVKPGHKMNCYWCSTQRRKELLHYAIEKGFTAIALGHHLDDILETLLMNILEKGKFDSMDVNFKYDKYPLRIIRPLCYVPVNLISEYAVNSGWKSMTCTCTYQANSGRKTARKRLEALTDGDYSKKIRLFETAFSAISALKKEETSDSTER